MRARRATAALFAALALLLIAVACDNSPISHLPIQSIVANTGQKMLGLKSYQMSVTIKSSTGDQDATLSGDVVPPDRAHLTFTQKDQPRELLILGAGQSYQKSGDAWMSIPRSGIVITSFQQLWTDQTSMTPDKLEDLGREAVGDVTTQHIRLNKVNVGHNVIGTEELWIYEGDFTTRRLMTFANLGTGNVRTTVEFSNFDSVPSLPTADKVITATPAK